MIRAVAIGLHLVLGVSAIAAGQSLALEPSGDGIGLEAAWLEGSPFPDYLVPGLFLVFVIAPTNLGSALAQWRRLSIAPGATFGTGALLVVWLAIQTAIIGFQDWIQAMWAVVFSLTAASGLWQILQSRRG